MQDIQGVRFTWAGSGGYSECNVDASRAVVLIFCESPHIMSLKENELYVILEGQGFEYMQNDDNNELSRKYKVYEN